MAGGRTGQGELVTMIVFIILTIVLGATTYFGFKSLSERKAELQTAQTELSNVKSETEKSVADFARIKTLLGYEDGDDASKIVDQMTLDVTQAYATEFDETVKEKVASKYEKDESATNLAENVTFKDALAELKKKNVQLAAEVADSANERDRQMREAEAQVERSEEQTGEYQAASDKALQDKTAENDKFIDDYQKETLAFNDTTRQFYKVLKDAHAGVAEAKGKAKENQQSAETFADINLDLSKRIDELSEPDFDTPDGRVVFADQIGRTVRLNIGKLDGVRPLTKFNVYPYNFLDFGGGTSKGVVEVERNIEDHSCEAKIVSDDDTNPIRPGDMIYTSLWKPGEIDEYALDYNLDIDGDGVSDLQEVVNLIEASGLKIAAYIDNNGEVHGKITPRVTRLVVPDKSLTEILNADDTLDAERRTQLEQTVDAFHKLADSNGVRQMRLADFLVRIDYKYTDEIYNSGEDDNPAMKSAVGSEPTIPMIKTFDKPDKISVAAPEKARGSKSTESAEPTFRRRNPI